MYLKVEMQYMTMTFSEIVGAIVPTVPTLKPPLYFSYKFAKKKKNTNGVKIKLSDIRADLQKSYFVFGS